MFGNKKTKQMALFLSHGSSIHLSLSFSFGTSENVAGEEVGREGRSNGGGGGRWWGG